MYDTGKALQALVKIIHPKIVDKRWSDDDAVGNLLPLTLHVLHNITLIAFVNNLIS